MPTTVDLVRKDILVGVGGDDRAAVAANGHDLEQQARRDAAADHGSKRLAIGRLIKEVHLHYISSILPQSDTVN